MSDPLVPGRILGSTPSLLPEIVEEQASETRAEEYQKYERLLPSSFFWPQPWCRQCQEGVDNWSWEDLHEAGLLVRCKCHGEECEGVLPFHFKRYAFRVEAFAYDDPHMEHAPLWIVMFDGSEAQPSRQYLDAAIQSGHDHPVFAGKFGRTVRQYGPAIAFFFGLATYLYFAVFH